MKVGTNKQKTVIEANSQFALDLYAKLSTNQKYSAGNLFFSPFSIYSALTIAYEGARGITSDEIQNVLRLPKDDNARYQEFLEINSSLKGEQPENILRISNALWAGKQYPFLPEYIATVQQFYSAKVTNLDFLNNPEESRMTVNHLVEEKTDNKIHNLIPEGMINPMTRLLITNTIYFKGTWDKPFDSTKTHEEKFRIAPDKSVYVQMMQTTGKSFMYAETESLQIIVMRYTQSSGKLLSMIVLLPKEDNLNAIEDQLNMQKLAELRKKLNYDQVDVYFPKFKVESEYLVHETLAEMGMPIAFTNRADFSGMDGTHNLFISDVMHKAFVEVNERGTEAAASTYISPPSLPHIFKVNHPFIFLIQDSETGNLLFMGRITNPNG